MLHIWYETPEITCTVIVLKMNLWHLCDVTETQVVTAGIALFKSRVAVQTRLSCDCEL